ncbi:MAG: NAD(P)H-dependent oxidoreductase [Chloroflexota bacterium]|nr:NAD(P)H-dependent oxidoreductase [Chloroflexota bacterium]
MSSKKILLILGHPNSDSFCHSLAKSFSEGAESGQNEVKKIDLYKEKFNPVYDLKDDDKNIKNYQNLVTESDVLVFVYPTWWFRAPAIIEGWIDRVMTTPFAYTFKQIIGNFGRPVGKLNDKKAIIIQTYGSPRFATKLWFFNLPIRRIKRGCFNVLGFKSTKFYPFFRVPFVENNKRLKMLNKVYKIGKKL